MRAPTILFEKESSTARFSTTSDVCKKIPDFVTIDLAGLDGHSAFGFKAVWLCVSISVLNFPVFVNISVQEILS